MNPPIYFRRHLLLSNKLTCCWANAGSIWFLRVHSFTTCSSWRCQTDTFPRTAANNDHLYGHTRAGITCAVGRGCTIPADKSSYLSFFVFCLFIPFFMFSFHFVFHFSFLFNSKRAGTWIWCANVLWTQNIWNRFKWLWDLLFTVFQITVSLWMLMKYEAPSRCFGTLCNRASSVELCQIFIYSSLWPSKLHILKASTSWQTILIEWGEKRVIANILCHCSVSKNCRVSSYLSLSVCQSDMEQRMATPCLRFQKVNIIENSEYCQGD